MKVLTKRQILLLHSALIRQSGGSDGIRDEGLLDSAVSTPFQTFADQELYPSLLASGTLDYNGLLGWLQEHLE